MISFKEHSFTFNNVSLTPSEQIGLHRQPLWELSYIVTGSGMRLIGDMTEPFQCGEVVMIPPEIPHCWILIIIFDTDANGQISNITITFANEFLDNCSSVFPELRRYIESVERYSWCCEI